MDKLTEAEDKNTDTEDQDATAHVKVTEDTWEQLNQRKTVGDRFEDVIRDLLGRAEAVDDLVNKLDETEVELLDVRLALEERDDLEGEPVHLDFVVDSNHPKSEEAYESLEQVKREMFEGVGEDGT
jgi:predicted CopG family antitoxin